MPNRILKETICCSDDIDQLSPFEETVFYRLIVNADDYGRLDARPSFLRSTLFRTKESVTKKNVEDAVNHLASVGLVRLYEVDRKSFLLFPTWENHQQIRAKKSKFPAPDSTCNQMISDDRICPRNPIQSESNPNPNTKGAAAPTGDGKQKRGEFGWVKLSDDEYRRIIEEFGEDTTRHYIAYVDESAQQTGNKNKWKDWNLTVRKAIRNKWGSGSAADKPKIGIDWSGFDDEQGV